MTLRIIHTLARCLLCIPPPDAEQACVHASRVASSSVFRLAGPNRAPAVYVDPGDAPVVRKAAGLFAADEGAYGETAW